ncbi:alpha-L-rhamnosidase [Gordonia sp. KTR9]|nr:alpha-L-rhamnosidase [Gordonia sp. KTR9]
MRGQVRTARLRASALGWYRAFVNGDDQTGPALVPRWTPFDQYVEFQDYDVTTTLVTGNNRIGLVLGDGRYRGGLGAFQHDSVYGDRLAGWAQLTIEYVDGTRDEYVTDTTWKVGAGPIVRSDPMAGEVVDLRVPSALDPATVIGGFPHAAVTPSGARQLIAEEVERVTEIGRLSAASIIRTPSGKQLVDFGQNASGVVRIRLSGPPGRVVRLNHGEIKGADGELDIKYLTPFRAWPHKPQTDQVTLDGRTMWWQPWFTIHGFRFVEVEGLDANLTSEDIEFVVLSTALEETGSFTASDPRLQKLYENVRWSMRSNFTDTPTDCPTRERSGWTGDAQVFAAAGTVFADIDAYFRRFLRNLAAEQLPDGRMPIYAPAEASEFSGGMARTTRMLSGSAGWGDAIVLIPWTLYSYYGDTTVLESSYPAAQRWIDFLGNRAAAPSRRKRGRRGRVSAHHEQFIVEKGFDWGEWMRPGESFLSSAVDSFRRSGATVATAYYEHSARVLGKIAGVLERTDDERRYTDLADSIRLAWREAYLGPDGRIGIDRQDDYVRALAFGLLDEQERPAAAARLAGLVIAADYHLGTGFLSTPMLLDTLRDNGYADVAYRLLLQETTPSWLDQVNRGATTTWETWEGYTKRGSAANSHNHYSFGAVARFLVEHVAGVAPGKAGFETIEFRPGLESGLTSAAAAVGTPRGTASIAWRKTVGHFSVHVVVPPGALGKLEISSESHLLTEGEHDLHVTIHGTLVNSRDAP